MKSTRTVIAIVIAETVILLYTASVKADIINVPADQPTIQAGIDAAVDGDEVVVAPGTYNENIDFSGKDIALHGAEGPQVTIIEAILLGPAVRIDGGESQTATLEGFTVTHSNNAVGQGMRILGDVATTINNCVFRDNIASQGGGMLISNTTSTAIADCLFLKNTGTWGGGIWSNSPAAISVTNTMFDNNLVHVLNAEVLYSM